MRFTTSKQIAEIKSSVCNRFNLGEQNPIPYHNEDVLHLESKKWFVTLTFLPSFDKTKSIREGQLLVVVSNKESFTSFELNNDFHQINLDSDDLLEEINNYIISAMQKELRIKYR